MSAAAAQPGQRLPTVVCPMMTIWPAHLTALPSPLHRVRHWCNFKFSVIADFFRSRVPETLQWVLRFFYGLIAGGTDADMLADKGVTAACNPCRIAPSQISGARWSVVCETENIAVWQARRSFSGSSSCSKCLRRSSARSGRSCRWSSRWRTSPAGSTVSSSCSGCWTSSRLRTPPPPLATRSAKTLGFVLAPGCSEHGGGIAGSNARCGGVVV